MRLTELAQLPSCFITATDTDAGKTYVATQILNSWKEKGFSVAALKPIATGAIFKNNQLVSEDALALAEVTGQNPVDITPFLFERPASPHIADNGLDFNLPTIITQLIKLQATHDRVIVEGIGGWCVPLSEQLMLKDLVIACNLPVVMVARIGLGCINHSLLTLQQIQRDCGLLYGWIANVIDPNFTDIDSNITSIEQRMTSGTVNFS